MHLTDLEEAVLWRLCVQHFASECYSDIGPEVLYGQGHFRLVATGMVTSQAASSIWRIQITEAGLNTIPLDKVRQLREYYCRASLEGPKEHRAMAAQTAGQIDTLLIQT